MSSDPTAWGNGGDALGSAQGGDAAWGDYNDGSAWPPPGFNMGDGDSSSAWGMPAGGFPAGMSSGDMGDSMAFSQIFGGEGSSSMDMGSMGFPPGLCRLACGCFEGNSTNGTQIQMEDRPFWDLEILQRDDVMEYVRVAGLVGLGLAVVSLLHTLFRLAPHWRDSLRLFRTNSNNLLTPVLKAKILETKVRHFQALMQGGCYILMPITIWVSFTNFHSGGDHSVALAQNILALFALWPTLVTPLSLDAVFLFTSALLSLCLSPLLCGAKHMLPTLLLGDGLFMVLVAVRRTGFTRLPVLASAAVLHGLGTCGLLLARGERLEDFQYPLVALQGLASILIPLTAPFMERWSQAWLTQSLDLEELQEQLAASQGLLRNCYDAILELDEAGMIVGTGPDFGTLLQRESQLTSMKGEAFKGLIEGEGPRADFGRRFTESSAKETMEAAENMQVTMRDNSGNLLRLEVTWNGFNRLGAESRERHVMVGLRDSTVNTAAKQPQQRLPPAVQERIVAKVTPDMVKAPPEIKEPPDNSTLEKSASDDTADAEDDSDSTMGTDAILVVDPDTRGWPVLKTSSAFNARVGRLPKGQPLLEFVKKHRDFENWLDDVLNMSEEEAEGNDLENNGAERRERPEFRVVFKMPSGKVSAVCRFLGEDEGEGTALMFHGIEQVGREEARSAPPADSNNNGPAAPDSNHARL